MTATWMFPPEVHSRKLTVCTPAHHGVGCVIEDPTTVALECLGNCNGAGNGPPGIDLRHHLCLSSYLTMFSDVVLGHAQEKGSEMEHGERGGRGRKGEVQEMGRCREGGGAGKGEVQEVEVGWIEKEEVERRGRGKRRVS